MWRCGDAMMSVSHYDHREIVKLHQQFTGEAPSGYIQRTSFNQLSGLMGIKSQFLSNLVFNAFDLNSDGYISFGEFIQSMSTMTRGTPDEKLRLAFRLYDHGGESGRPRGYLVRQDMLTVVEELHSMLGDLITTQGGALTPQALVDKLFDEMDVDRDGRISFDEYLQGARRDPAIVQGLALNF
eukprot:Sspe_Gene.68595::Locus_40443_Transcript_1_1_Confidence_1.000_Length_762::g.68595::m.68595/K19932/NCS1; neuronal calcium sensor 1